jgi:hypothetical protein
MIPSLTLFVHVVGMLTLFVGLGLEWASLDGLQRSITREQALPWLRLVVMVPVSRSPMRALKRVVDVPADGTVALRAAAANPILRLALRIRIAFGLAIVFLMIAKPAVGESLLVLALASILTIATSLTRRTTPFTAVQGYR